MKNFAVSLSFLILFSHSIAFADSTQVLKTCTVASTDPSNDATYTVNIVSMDLAAIHSGDSWPAPVYFAVVYYSGPYVFQGHVQSVHVTNEVGVYSISPGGPLIPAGTDYYAGVTAGTL